MCLKYRNKCIFTSVQTSFVFQFFVRLDHIRKCFTQNGGIFVIEEFSEYYFSIILEMLNLVVSGNYLTYIHFSLHCIADPKTRQIVQRKYKSIMVSMPHVTLSMQFYVFVLFTFVFYVSYRQRK